MKNLNSFITLLILLGGTMSCTSLRNVTPAPGVIVSSIKPNDNIEVLLADGTEIRRMRVDAIDSGRIIGTCVTRASGDRNKTTRTIAINEIKGVQRLKNGRLRVVKLRSNIRVTLNSGVVIRLKVSAIDAEKITGIEKVQLAPQQWVKRTRVIQVSVIARVQIREPAPVRTVALVAYGVAFVVGIIISPPNHSSYLWP